MLIYQNNSCATSEKVEYNFNNCIMLSIKKTKLFETEWVCQDCGRHAHTNRCCAGPVVSVARRLRTLFRRWICHRQSRVISASGSSTSRCWAKTIACRLHGLPATSTLPVPTLKNVIDGAIGTLFDETLLHSPAAPPFSSYN